MKPAIFRLADGGDVIHNKFLTFERVPPGNLHAKGRGYRKPVNN